MSAISDQEYSDFSIFLEKKCGIVLGESKHYLVKSRLNPLVKKFEFDSLSALIQAVLRESNKELVVAIIDAMTTNETLWFRDGYPFDVLAKMLLPDLTAANKNVRIWSAASSSGQEPYSIAMTLLEQDNFHTKLSSASITATDISTAMLQHCNEAVYDELALARGLSKERSQRFFDSEPDGRMKVKNEVKQLIQFRPQNLLDSYAALGKFDIIFCRNVLIYFSIEQKSDILNRMASSLNPGGYLLLGASESLTGLSEHYEMIRCNPGIIYKLK